MNKLLLEELNKFKLLSSYNTKITLNENKFLISEAPKVMKDVISSIRIGDEILKDIIGGLKTTANVKLNNWAEVVDAVEKDLLSPAGYGQLRKSILKKVSDPDIKLAIAHDMALNAKTFQGKTNQQIVDLLTSNHNFSYSDAKLVADEYDKIKSTGGSTQNAGSSSHVFGGGMIINSVTPEIILQHVKVDPILDDILKKNKNAESKLVEWLKLNITPNTTIENELPKVEQYLLRFQGLPKEEKKYLQKILNFLKLGKEGGEATKGLAGWVLLIVVLGVGLRWWTLKDVLNKTIDRTGIKQTDDSKSGDESNHNVYIVKKSKRGK